MRHRFGIRKKIMLTMAFMTIIPVLVMGIVSTAQSRNIIKEQHACAKKPDHHRAGDQ